MKALLKAIFVFLFMLLFTPLIAQVDTAQIENHKDSLGRKQGRWVEFYSNGKCKSIAYYKDDKLDSTHKSFRETGELEVQSNFKNGLHHGSYTVYYKTGEMNKLNFYNMGEPIWTSIYDKEGYLLMEEIFHNGKCVTIIHYDKGKYITRGTPKN